MKKLLNRTLQTFTLYSLIVLVASIPAYYYLVDGIWLKELDEHNKIIADRTRNELSGIELTEEELSESIRLWNRIQPGTNLKEYTEGHLRNDSVYTISRRNPYAPHTDINRFRGLVRIIEMNGKPYELTIETNVEETEETAIAIAALTLIFFLILVIGFLLLNRRLSFHLWKPFRNTLTRLQAFNLNKQVNITFEKSDTIEFEELNTALNRLIEQNISAYKIQKEFTENASHEIQTPLAIIKNKLDLLLQEENLTNHQYQIIEEINKALTRISRINKNLLLLAKIENHQFDHYETVNISLLTIQCLEQLQEYSANKNIMIHQQIENDIIITGNKTLVEILVNNLILNAIRYSQQKTIISVSLSEDKFIISNPGNKTLDSSAMYKRFASLSEDSSGSGLGLALVKEICNCHQWEINYQFKDNFHIFSIQF